jgi:hypothetical protein
LVREPGTVVGAGGKQADVGVCLDPVRRLPQHAPAGLGAAPGVIEGGVAEGVGCRQGGGKAPSVGQAVERRQAVWQRGRDHCGDRRDGAVGSMESPDDGEQRRHLRALGGQRAAEHQVARGQFIP